MQLESRQTQMFMDLYQSKFDKNGLEAVFTILNLEWEDEKDYMTKYSGIEGNTEIPAIFESQAGYMDGLGLLVKKKMIDVDTVYDIAGTRVILLWFKLETLVKAFRDPKWGVPDYAEHFEYLADEMLRIRKQRGHPIPYTNYLHPSSELFKEYNP